VRKRQGDRKRWRAEEKNEMKSRIKGRNIYAVHRYIQRERVGNREGEESIISFPSSSLLVREVACIFQVCVILLKKERVYM